MKIVISWKWLTIEGKGFNYFGTVNLGVVSKSFSVFLGHLGVVS